VRWVDGGMVHRPEDMGMGASAEGQWGMRQKPEARGEAESKLADGRRLGAGELGQRWLMASSIANVDTTFKQPHLSSRNYDARSSKPSAIATESEKSQAGVRPRRTEPTSEDHAITAEVCHPPTTTHKHFTFTE
jgi:hypothetical protein